MTPQKRRKQVRWRGRALGAMLCALTLFLLVALLVQAWGSALLLSLLLFGTLAAFPWLRGGLETTELNQELRNSWPGKQFVALSDGVTHYQLLGPEHGQPVVLVTGLASSFFIWDAVAEALARAGFRVLRYDNFGRGLSDRPAIPYDGALFQRQLAELLDALHVSQPVDLIGLSMGGLTVARFVDAFPHRVRRYVLIAPAGLPYSKNAKERLLQCPLIGDWLMAAFGDKNIVRALPAEIGDDTDKVNRAIAAYHEQMQYRGYRRALLSTLRHNPLGDALPVFERLGARATPALLLWGTEDTIIPFAFHSRIQAAIPHIQFYAVEGGTHPVCYQRPEEVAPILVDFLRANE